MAGNSELIESMDIWGIYLLPQIYNKGSYFPLHVTSISDIAAKNYEVIFLHLQWVYVFNHP